MNLLYLFLLLIFVSFTISLILAPIIQLSVYAFFSQKIKYKQSYGIAFKYYLTINIIGCGIHFFVVRNHPELIHICFFLLLIFSFLINSLVLLNMFKKNKEKKINFFGAFGVSFISLIISMIFMSFILNFMFV